MSSKWIVLIVMASCAALVSVVAEQPPVAGVAPAAPVAPTAPVAQAAPAPPAFAAPAVAPPVPGLAPQPAPVPVPPGPAGANNALSPPVPYPQPHPYQNVAPYPYPGAPQMYSMFGGDAKSMQEYAKLETQALEAARAYRKGSDSLGTEHPQQVERREQLSKLVEKAFDVRQESQNKELNQLRERIAKVEQAINKRSQNRQQIIEKRVKELLEEDRELEWNASATPQANSGVVRYAANVDGTITQIYEPRSVPPANAGLPGVPGIEASGTGRVPQFQTIRTFPGGPTVVQELPGTASRTNLQFATQQMIAQPPGADQRQALALAMELVRQKESESAGWKKQLKEDELDESAAYQNAIRELQSAKRQLDRMKQEYDAQLKLLKLDVQAAQAEVEAAKQQVFVGQSELAENGTVSKSEVNRLEAMLRHAEVKLQKATTLLDLHQSVLQSIIAPEAAPTTTPRR